MTPIDKEGRIRISRGQFEALVPAKQLDENNRALIEQHLERLNMVADQLEMLEANYNITFQRVLRINAEPALTMH